MNRGLRIAVAEDEPLMQKYLEETLTLLGFQVLFIAGTGGEFVEKSTAMRPDLLITDIRMPDIDGLEAAARIYAIEPVPIIVITAFHDQALIERAERNHVLAYLVKPINRLAVRFMTPVFFLSDGYLANGGKPMAIPNLEDLPRITPEFATTTNGTHEGKNVFLPYKRDDRLVRQWAVPGTPGLEHRIGGIEKQRSPATCPMIRPTISTWSIRRRRRSPISLTRSHPWK